MNRFLRWNLKAYRATLLLYPEDLRRDFGAEMAEAFEEDLASECDAGNLTGVIRVWRVTLREFLQIALIRQFENPLLAVPVLAALVSLASQASILALALKRESALNFHVGGSIPAEIAIVVLLPSLITACAAFAVVRRRKGDRLVSLGLTR